MFMADDVRTFFVRPGVVEYYDLAEHEDVSREDAFTKVMPKVFRKYGLIHKSDGLVRVMHEDDLDDNSECEVMVIPYGCIIQITYFKVDSFDPEFIDPDAPLLDKDSNVN